MRILKILCIFFVSLAFAQPAQIWERMQKKMEQGISGKFRLTKYAAKISKQFVSEGTFTVTAKDGAILETEKPVKERHEFQMKKLFSDDFKELLEKFDLELKGDTLILIAKEKSIKEMMASAVMVLDGDNLRSCKIIRSNNDYVLYEFMVP
ncbi:MAG: hypothetical protein FWC26_10515 [Fibromonadales bacterium]|nr:hypothetical protein [Fibromonadales bacterium]